MLANQNQSQQQNIQVKEEIANYEDPAYEAKILIQYSEYKNPCFYCNQLLPGSYMMQHIQKYHWNDEEMGKSIKNSIQGHIQDTQSYMKNIQCIQFPEVIKKCRRKDL